MLQVKERRHPWRRLTTSHSRKTGRPHRLSLARVRPHPSPSPKTNGRTDLPSSEKTLGHPEGGHSCPPLLYGCFRWAPVGPELGG